MINIDNAKTYAWDAAMRGMRNPMNSWAKSDSGYCKANTTSDMCDMCDTCFYGDKESNGLGGYTRICYNNTGENVFVIGKNDLALAKRLVEAGTDHSKFMRMIIISVDITAPLYWWKEFDTYKVGTVADSCSTMHKIHSKEFTVKDFSADRLSPTNLIVLQIVIDALNNARLDYNVKHDKSDWWQMIQLLPSSYNQKRTVSLNYAVLRNIYHARRNHKLDEWQFFCDWIEMLPYSELITN